MKQGFWVLKVLKFIVLGALFVTAMGFIVMSLWNWLVPELFSGPVIGFGQAIGLLVLSKILFGFGGGRGGRCHSHKGYGWRKRMEAKMAGMTEEERNAFRTRMRERCGKGNKWGMNEKND